MLIKMLYVLSNLLDVRFVEILHMTIGLPFMQCMDGMKQAS